MEQVTLFAHRMAKSREVVWFLFGFQTETIGSSNCKPECGKAHAVERVETPAKLKLDFI